MDRSVKFGDKMFGERSSFTPSAPFKESNNVLHIEREGLRHVVEHRLNMARRHFTKSAPMRMVEPSALRYILHSQEDRLCQLNSC